MLTPFIKRTTDEQATGQPVVMEMGSAQEFGLVLTLLALALLAGLIFDAMALSLLLAVLIWLGVQIRQFRRVYRWSRRPWRRPRNGFDSWFNLAYRPYRALMRERVRSRQVTARLRQILDLVELIPDGVIVLSANGEIEGMNNAATRILQIGDNDVGLVLSTLVRSPDFVSFIRSKEVSEEPQILEFTSPVNPDHTLEA
ncbi:MAG: phosphate regulon sensor protein PhoR [Roseibium album]|uniref:phosphate regulon sensor protein PhoR n=1 Tax=Roseibium album TaxID=311410 RepID=UPI0032ED29D1